MKRTTYQFLEIQGECHSTGHGATSPQRTGNPFPAHPGREPTRWRQRKTMRRRLARRCGHTARTTRFGKYSHHSKSTNHPRRLSTIRVTPTRTNVTYAWDSAPVEGECW